MYMAITINDFFQCECYKNTWPSHCWAHARRAFADAVKAADKKDPGAVKSSVAYQALQKIAEFYQIDTELKELPATDRLTQRQTRIKPLVEDFFAWAKQQAAECAVPPKSKTGQGLNFVIHQENYLKVFLTDGDIPIDNSASERAIRTFCIGKKNWRDCFKFCVKSKNWYKICW